MAQSVFSSEKKKKNGMNAWFFSKWKCRLLSLFIIPVDFQAGWCSSVCVIGTQECPGING